jgi:hypothetical protein
MTSGVAAHATETLAAVATWRPSILPRGETPEDGAQQTTLVTDADRRILYAISNEGTWLAAYNLDTRQPLGPAVAPQAPVTSLYVDPTSGVLYAGESAFSGSQLEAFTDTPTLRSSGVLQTTTLGAQASIVGMVRDSQTKRLFLMASVLAPDSTVQRTRFVPGTVAIGQVTAIDPTGNSPGHLDWVLPLQACSVPIATMNQIGFSLGTPAAAVGWRPSASALYFGCGATGLVINDRVPAPAGVGRLTVGPSPSDTPPVQGDFTLFPRSGAFVYGDSLFDPSSRRLILSSGGAGQPVIITAFDTGTETYVGTVDAGSNSLVGLGLDDQSGVLCGFSGSSSVGLFLAAVRTTPVSQRLDFPEYDGAAPQDHFAQKTNTLAADGRTHTFFVYYSDRTGHVEFLLVRHSGGVALSPSANPDANTQNLAESPGQTGRTYSGSAQGFGAIIRSAGGLDGLATDFTGVGNVFGSVPVGPGTREIDGAYLQDLSLSLDEARSSVVTSRVDQGNTGHDLGDLCAIAEPAGTRCGWPDQPASCDSFGAKSTSHSDALLGRAEAGCDLGASATTATANEGALSTPAVTIGQVTIVAGSRLSAISGMVTDVSATAQGVDVANGALYIGSVTTTVEARAHGRPGTAATMFSRSLRGVVLEGTELCGDGAHDQCDPNTIAAEINTVLAGYVHVDFPEPDPRLAAGSPGGYQSMVRRPLGDQIQEEGLNDQPPDRVEVPGMVVTLYTGDSLEPSRQVVYLAGVEAEARYGIYSLSDLADISWMAGQDSGTGSTAAGPLASSPAADSRSATTALSPPSTKPTEVPTGGGVIGALLPRGGWSWLVEHPVAALKLLFMWIVLLSPVYVAARRWLLLQRNRILGEVTA